ncbi:MAG TPA: hypothetical protein VK642_01500 [Burkholderiales bacterium]|nr:hypothetical protein [Burkholderiales bacterium]
MAALLQVTVNLFAVKEGGLLRGSAAMSMLVPATDYGMGAMRTKRPGAPARASAPRD